MCTNQSTYYICVKCDWKHNFIFLHACITRVAMYNVIRKLCHCGWVWCMYCVAINFHDKIFAFTNNAHMYIRGGPSVITFFANNIFVVRQFSQKKNTKYIACENLGL